LMLHKNKYFDKHPQSQLVLKRAAGESIVFAKSDMLWQQKRKALSASMYKDKLKKMVEGMKEVTISMVGEWTRMGEIDIVKEASNLFMKITLVCLFGEGNEDLTVPQRENGQIV
jgi:cytochrome P450